MPQGICPGAYAQGHMPQGICPGAYARGHMPGGICPGAYALGHMPQGIRPRAYAPGHMPCRSIGRRAVGRSVDERSTDDFLGYCYRIAIEVLSKLSKCYRIAIEPYNGCAPDASGTNDPAPAEDANNENPSLVALGKKQNAKKNMRRDLTSKLFVVPTWSKNAPEGTVL